MDIPGRLCGRFAQHRQGPHAGGGAGASRAPPPGGARPPPWAPPACAWLPSAAGEQDVRLPGGAPNQGQGPHPSTGGGVLSSLSYVPARVCLGGTGPEASLGADSLFLVEKPLCAG